VHTADRAVLSEPALARRLMDQPPVRRALRPSYPLEDSRTDTAANAISGTLTSHIRIITG